MIVNYFNTLLVGIFLLFYIPSYIYAQQLTQFSLFQEHIEWYNPAVLGTDPYFKVMASYRDQWSKIPEAPSSAFVGVSSSIKGKRFGLGGYISYDAIGPFQFIYSNLSMAYHIPLSKKISQYRNKNRYSNILSFGINIALNHTRINGNKLRPENTSDPTIINAQRGVFSPNAGIGIYYQHKSGFVGFSIDQLFGYQSVFRDIIRSSQFKQERHFYMLAGGIIRLGSKNNGYTIEPTFHLKYAIGTLPQGTINIKFRWVKAAWIGIAYRSISQMIFSAGIHIKKKYFISYAYDLDLRQKTNPSILGHSHEIQAKFRFISKNSPFKKGNQLGCPRF